MSEVGLEDPFASRWLRPVLGTTVVMALSFLALQPVLGAGPPLMDPLVQGSAVGLLAASALLWASRRGVKGWHVHAFVGAITILVWVFSFVGVSRASPLEETTAVALPLMLAAVFCGFRSTASLAVLTMVATLVLAVTGEIGAGVVESFVLSNLIFSGFATAMAAAIEKERSTSRTFTAEVRNARATLVELIANVPDALVSVDEKGSVQVANPAAMRMFQSWGAAPPVAGADILKGIPTPLAKAYGKMRRTGAPVEVDFHVQRDEDFHYRATVCGLGDAEGSQAGVLVIRDVSQVDRIQELVDQARADGGRNVLNMVSHQLSTPLMPILIKSHLLLDPKQGVQAEQRDAVEVIQRNAKRALEMVEAIVEATRNSRESDEALRRLADVVKP